jgi:hypothetical protein
VLGRNLTFAAAVSTVALLTGSAAGAPPAGGGGNPSAPGQQAPVNLAPPAVGGSAVAGASLTAAPGTWTGNGLKYAYQWLRCDSGGASCAAVGGASGSSYGLGAADVGTTLRVSVTASNGNGSGSATSSASSAIAAASSVPPPSPPPPSPPPPSTVTQPSNTSLPTIIGSAQQGQTLTAATGSWSGTTPLSYSYQWSRCDSAGASCSAIAGATATSYALSLADVESSVRVSLTASNSAGSVTATSNATAPIQLVTAPPTATPPYFLEHFDGLLSNPTFWYFSPTSYFLSWPTDGALNQAARVTACAAARVGICADGRAIADSSAYGQLTGIESYVTTARCSAIHAGYSSGDCSTAGAVGKAGDETWYRYKIRFPSSYKPTPGTQNVTWELHVDRGSEADSGGNVGSTMMTISADGDPSVLCPGSPHFCTTPGTNPRMMLQVAGGLDTDPLYPNQIHRYTASNPLLLDHWYDVTLHFVFSPDASVGYVQWWLDGVKQLDTHVSTQYRRRNGTLGYGEDVGVYNYRYWANWASPIDYDEVLTGPTAASINFPG